MIFDFVLQASIAGSTRAEFADVLSTFSTIVFLAIQRINVKLGSSDFKFMRTAVNCFGIACAKSEQLPSSLCLFAFGVYRRVPTPNGEAPRAQTNS